MSIQLAMWHQMTDTRGMESNTNSEGVAMTYTQHDALDRITARGGEVCPDMASDGSYYVRGNGTVLTGRITADGRYIDNDGNDVTDALAEPSKRERGICAHHGPYANPDAPCPKCEPGQVQGAHDGIAL
jgi:hypothetical protein